MHDDSHLPVLNAVARRGNDSIISSTRLGHEVLDELEAMRRDCASRADLAVPHDRDAPPAIDFTGLTGGVVHLSAEVDEPAGPLPESAPVSAPGGAMAGDALVGPDDPTLEIDPMPALAATARLHQTPDVDVFAAPSERSSDASSCVASHESSGLTSGVSNHGHSDGPMMPPIDAPLATPALERRIDELVERHVQALRLELRHLLKGALSD